MKKSLLFTAFLLILWATPCLAATPKTDALPEAKASETDGWQVESLVPMFFYDGYHAAIAYRKGSYRVRTSVIYSGSYNAEKAGKDNHADDFSRYYDHGSFGVFGDYFIWKGLHAFVFVESHQWLIESKQSGAKASMSTIDYGPGLGYQYDVGKRFYVQPAVHFYFRDQKSVGVGNETYTIPAMDSSVVLRLGYRF